MIELTDCQKQIVDFIEMWRRDTGSAPTFREIGDHFNRSLGTVIDHVNALRKKGLLPKKSGKARSIQIQSSLRAFRRSIVDIPLYGSIPAGFAGDREQEPSGYVSVDAGTIGLKPSRNIFALRVTGDSMIGKHICNGDIVVVERGSEPRPGQVVAALVDQTSTLKTFIVENGRAYLKAENPKYPDLIPSEELLIQGKMIALVRRWATLCLTGLLSGLVFSVTLKLFFAC
jgi:repressor LexA